MFQIFAKMIQIPFKQILEVTTTWNTALFSDCFLEKFDLELGTLKSHF